VVNVSAERKPLADILAELRKQTGANIVLDPRCETQEKKAGLTVSLNDVRLYDALRVIADMAELKLVYAGNVYYVTTPANAKVFQPPAPRPAP
jgi:type II secretory pathway component GspD/PulD (secretin)